MTIIGTKWVFRNKLDENGVVSQNKARLVAQGYNQQEGIDYDETYSPVARLESIRILLAYACALDFKLFQMDVKNAFLNGFINEEVYATQPPGFINFEKPDHVYKLKKALYGLKQAPKALVINPSSNPTPSTNPNPKGRNRRRSKQRIEELNLEELSPPIVMMSDQRTMAQLLQAPTEGYEDAIVFPAITADNFELKHGLLTLVQNKQFFGHDKEDPHAHIRYFNKITSTLKFP
nr:copia protein [Tanacetum cinerariifolium]